ncbi:phospho-sugar mutase, partial [Roseburia hominis]|uniref:phospho-sugar mutase n=1 Tax=Roseburia hominis TaxID=301301 RepID=UPI001C035B89
LRGVIGAGTNRMNIYTVRQATQGLANYILSQNGQEKGVAIAHDSRIMSTEFADEAALCLNANGIKAYVFDSLRPTPELSFAVRELGCISGIVITASHNPREYNGYKVYWEDGAQITPPHDKNILAEVAKVTSFDQVKTMKKEDAVAAGLYKVIGKDELALKLAKEVDADIVLATDPDADRLGVYCKDTKTGEYVTFTGNMSGMLIAEYILREKTAMGTMPENPALVETIVTTDMAKAIAAAYNVKLIEVLTGFKYIGEQIKFFEQQHTYHYVFGLEESYGCLAGTYARDKDACVAVMMLCEVASWCKKHGKTLWDAMLDMYEKYGYYREGLETKTLKGIDGAAQIQSMMSEYRTNP